MLKFAPALIAGLVGMGGWAVVTVKEVPEYFVAGRQYTIEFQVRQHGQNFLSDLEPQLILSTSARRRGGLLGGGGGDEQRVAAASRGNGLYAVTFTAPRPGPLLLTIKSGFGASDLRLYPTTVVAAGTSPKPMAQADRGRILFVAKGCNVCHANSDLIDRPDNQQIAVGPALGGERRLARDYVIQKVKNPASQTMPDLGLSDGEAAAIAAFLSGERVAASGEAGGGSR